MTDYLALLPRVDDNFAASAKTVSTVNHGGNDELTKEQDDDR